jgi:hypothetical protein
VTPLALPTVGAWLAMAWCLSSLCSKDQSQDQGPGQGPRQRQGAAARAWAWKARAGDKGHRGKDEGESEQSAPSHKVVGQYGSAYPFVVQAFASAAQVNVPLRVSVLVLGIWPP